MRWLPPLLFAATASLVSAATFTWTGAGANNDFTNPANWLGGAAPPNDGSATVVFGDTGAGPVQLPLFGILNLAGIQFQTTATPYSFSGLTLINVQDGLSSSAPGGVRFSSSVVVSLTGSTQTVAVSAGTMEISGAVLGSATLSKTGAGNLVLSGLNLYSGGTRVEAGTLTFASILSVPVAGLIESSANAYVGVTFTNSVQSGFIDRLDKTNFTGSIGFDTAAGHASPATYTGLIDLTDLNSIAGIGSQTSARLTGNIKVEQGASYRFGGGAGTLFVEGNLTASSSNVEIKSVFGTPLTVVLRGTNTFNGTVNILNSVLVLDSKHALPGVSPFYATRRLNLTGPGYAGYTENFEVTPAGFLNRIGSIASPNAIIGIDSANTAAPRIVTDAIDLSAGGTRNDPYYLGTSSRVTLTGNITPTTGDSLYLTAVKGGHLTVGSTLGSGIPALVVGQTSSFDPQGGTVTLTGNNSYTGGTQVLGGTLVAGHNSALGLGGINVGDRATLSVASSVLLSNPLTLSRGATLSGTGSLATPGGVSIGPGVYLTPGGNFHIGTIGLNTGLTLEGGGFLNLNFLSATGTAGTSWDLLNVSGGALNLTATAANPFTINLVTLSANGTAGPVSIFDSTQSYSWTFATAGTINGFPQDAFSINGSAFLNNLGGGTFLVSQNGTGLSLNFTPIPEPSTYVLMALGLGIVAIFEFRRRKTK